MNVIWIRKETLTTFLRSEIIDLRELENGNRDFKMRSQNKAQSMQCNGNW